MFTVNRNPSRIELRKFGSAMLLGFGVIALILWCGKNIRTGQGWFAWTGGGSQITALALAALGVSLFTLSRVSESACRSVYVLWMTVFVPVGLVMSTIVLSLIYFIVLPIFSIIVRFSDPLRKKLKPDGTYWEDFKPFEPTLDRMRRMF
jgi:hypothetical protein